MVSHFTAALQKAQGMGMSAEQAGQLEADVATSGKIGASLSAVEECIAQKEQEAAERDAAYRTWRVEETTYILPPEPLSEPAPDLQGGLRAPYEGRKAREAEAG